MIKALKYKHQEIPGYFIDENGKIYSSDGVEQKQYLCPSNPYYFFKSRKVHIMMAHSFYGYKEGYDVHHLNQIKTDNRLENLMYLTHSEHLSLHKTGNQYCLGKKLSPVTKQKMSAARKDKKQVYCPELNKIFESIMQVARELKLSDSNICSCCNGKRKTCGGYHFSYYSGGQK